MKYTKEILNLADIDGMFQAHHLEAGWAREIPLDINVDALVACEKAGILAVYIARDNGEAVGYNFFILAPDMFRRRHMAATEIGLFMQQSHRAKHALQFMKWVDNNIEADIIYRGTPHSRDFGAILQRIGYQKITNVYGKVKKWTHSLSL